MKKYTSLIMADKAEANKRSMQSKVATMADAQYITQASAIGVMKAAGQAMVVARTEVSACLRNNAVNVGPKIGGPSLKQPTFDWGPTDMYVELRNFKLEINDIFQTYKVNQAKYQS